MFVYKSVRFDYKDADYPYTVGNSSESSPHAPIP